jgi:hypothetical protein
VGLPLAEGPTGEHVADATPGRDPSVVFDRKCSAGYRILSYFAPITASCRTVRMRETLPLGNVPSCQIIYIYISSERSGKVRRSPVNRRCGCCDLG